MRRRLIGGVLVFLFLWYPCLAAAYNFDQLLSHGMHFSIRPTDCMTALAHRPALLFFILFSAADLALMLCVLLGREYLNYHSKIISVAPGIEIPEPAGEGQFGTAWFLPPAQYGRQWSAYAVSRRNPRLRELLRRGREDLTSWETTRT